MRFRLLSIVLTIVMLPNIRVSAQESGDTLKRVPMSVFQRQYYDATVIGAGMWNSTILLPIQRLNYSDVKIGATGKTGDFHRPQKPKSSSMYNFCADGALNMGGFYLSAGFKFSQIFENDVKFTSILDPYRGTPYMIADSTGGDWQKQLYNMWLKVASPYYNDFVSVGISAGLDVGRGAKKTDPRPQANSNQIGVKPSVTFRLGSHSLGGNFSYRRFMENSNLMLYNSSESQKIYLMKGFGQYTYDIFSTIERERRYNGNGYGFGAQYAYNGSSTQVLLFGGYENYTEEAVDIEYNKPRKRGRLYETSYNFGLRATFDGDRMTHVVSARYDDIERSGREIIEVFNPSSGVNAWITDSEAPRRSVVTDKMIDLNYSLLLKKSAELTDWRFDLNATYDDFADEYAVMKSFLRYKNLYSSLRVQKSLNINDRNFIQASITGGYKYVWDKQMNIVGREETDKTIEVDFVGADVDYLFSSCYVGQVDVMYGYNLKNKNSIYVKGSFNRAQATRNVGRSVFSLWVGYNF